MRLKNTGVEAKLGLSAFIPVEIACPVFGHLIITAPTADLLERFLFLLCFYCLSTCPLTLGTTRDLT